MFNQPINQRNLIEKTEAGINSNAAIRKSPGCTIGNREISWILTILRVNRGFYIYPENQGMYMYAHPDYTHSL